MPIYPHAVIEGLNGEVLVRNLVVSVQPAGGKVHANFVLNSPNTHKIGIARRYRLVLEDDRSAEFSVIRFAAEKDGSASITAEVFSGKLG